MSEQMNKSIPMTVRFIPKIQTNKNSREWRTRGDTNYKLSKANKGKQNKPFSFVSFISMEADDEKKTLYASPTSSPPTPPSPLPVSVGPGNQKYLFSPSPSASPPFSPPSSHSSAENLRPLLLPEKLQSSPKVSPSTFSLDYSRPPPPDHLESRSSCLTDLLEWFIERCCNCCTKSSYQLENRSSSGAALKV